MIKSYKDLVVWQKSIVLAKHVYLLTRKLPKDEQFGLISQMRRAAISIPSNIAEGSKRGTKKDYSQFLRFALGSSAELETQLFLTNELYTINVDSLLSDVVEIQKMLATIVKKLST